MKTFLKFVIEKKDVTIYKLYYFFYIELAYFPSNSFFLQQSIFICSKHY